MGASDMSMSGHERDCAFSPISPSSQNGPLVHGYLGPSSPSVTSPPHSVPAPVISHPSLSGSWGIGGFATPTQSHLALNSSVTVVSTLGNPQMPRVSLFSRSPMDLSLAMGCANVCKRKAEDDIGEGSQHVKQHITEERVSHHLNLLHISDKYHTHHLGRKAAKGTDKPDEEAPSVSSATNSSASFFEDVLDDSPKKLVIADEVHQIKPGEPQIPTALLRKINAPSMEVVLWKPPGDLIRNAIKSLQHPAATTSTIEKEAAKDSKDTAGSDNGSSPDSGISVSSPPPALEFLTQRIPDDMDEDLTSMPSTSMGVYHRPSSPVPDVIADDFSDRMEFNNNSVNGLNVMWLEENNNTALMDLNSMATPPVDLLETGDGEDMDL